MLITYLGHAGFCVETESVIVVMDPWLSRYGAFDSSWFQYPKNHHMARYVLDLMNNSSKDKYIYISHEHKDHFDLAFLESLENRDFSIILANFHHSIVLDTLNKVNYQCKEKICLNNNEEFQFNDECSMVLFSIDAELECDSAVLFQTKNKKFLNINDCKLHERLADIVKKYGKIDVFAAQFSGAIWHPTCYDYDDATYQEISKSKKLIKFELTARAIETLNPTFYLPSAGPPCFLDPQLIETNFQKENIYPRSCDIIKYLNKRCKDLDTKYPDIMPGDVLDVDAAEFVSLSPIRVDDNNFYNYVTSYAKEYDDYFCMRSIENQKVDPKKVFMALGRDLESKIKNVKFVNDSVTTPLYWKISEYSELMYQINFKDKKLSMVDSIDDPNNYYLIEAPAWQVNKVLNKEMNWPDFALTFRVKLSRRPDVYNTLIHGFITLDAESIERHCELMKEYYDRDERMIITLDGKHYSVRRYCRHQGGDLSQGWIENGCLVCPRHRWKYDILNQGQCTSNKESIDAICLENEDEQKGN